MKNTLSRFLVGTLLLMMGIVFTGCPYSADFGLDARPAIKINKQLLGQYETKDSPGDTYTLLKKDKYLYKIEKRSSFGSSSETYNAYLSNLEGVLFLNIYEDESSNPTYYFYKLNISSGGNTVTLASVTNDITEGFSSSEELKKFFLKNMNLSTFYDKDEEVYFRK